MEQSDRRFQLTVRTASKSSLDQRIERGSVTKRSSVMKPVAKH